MGLACPRTLALALVLSLATCRLPGCAAEGQRGEGDHVPVEDVLQRAVELHTGGDLDGALQLYDDILRAFPREPDALHLKALAVWKRDGDEAQAAALIARAVQAQPDRAFFHNSLGEIHRHADRVDLALASYRDALLVKQEVGTWSNMALALGSAGRGAEAAHAFRSATELDPAQSGTWLGWGQLLMGRGVERFDRAVPVLARAVAIRPASFDARWLHSLALQQAGFMDEAWAGYERCAELDPGQPDRPYLPMLLNRGGVRQEQGRFDEAIEEYRALLVGPTATRTREPPPWAATHFAQQ